VVAEGAGVGAGARGVVAIPPPLPC
jgi:hypothetical protein